MYDITKFLDELDALYRVKAQKVEELMKSEKYKDAYSSIIDEGLKIKEKTVAARIFITKEPREPHERTLKIYTGHINEMVMIGAHKYDSKRKRRSGKKTYHLFMGRIEEFRDLDLVELVKKNLEEYIPID